MRNETTWRRLVTIYQSIVTNFPEEEYLPIRRAAESSLNQLNDMEKEPK